MKVFSVSNNLLNGISVNLMITTKQKSIVQTEKVRIKEPKHYTRKTVLNTNEDSREGGTGGPKIIRKQLTKW